VTTRPPGFLYVIFTTFGLTIFNTFPMIVMSATGLGEGDSDPPGRMGAMVLDGKSGNSRVWFTRVPLGNILYNKRTQYFIITISTELVS
jgi:hypothetical protein